MTADSGSVSASPGRLLRAGALDRFSCLGDACEDTCCQTWTMQVNDAVRERYAAQAPDLLDAVECGADGVWTMKRGATGHCVKLENGLCGIQRSRGVDYLGDACFFYPRSTRRLGETAVMTAMLSCPEIARLALLGDEPYALRCVAAERLPQTVKDYLPPALDSDQALAIHAHFLQAAQAQEVPAEHILARIYSVSRSLELVDIQSWPSAVPFYLAHADGRLSPPEAAQEDPFNLLHALCGLAVASHRPLSPRQRDIVHAMEESLAAHLDWENVTIATGEKSMELWQKVRTSWQSHVQVMQPLFKRWLQGQLALALFPFAGLGETLSERMAIIGVRFATVKLAIMCICSGSGAEAPQDIAVRVMQSLSRILDHLGDSAFSMRIYKEAGWTRESRLRGLIAL